MAVTGKLHLMHSEDYDWIGLYVDGKLIYEDHSIDERLMLELLGHTFTEEERPLHLVGRCPPTLNDESWWVE